MLERIRGNHEIFDRLEVDFERVLYDSAIFIAFCRNLIDKIRHLLV